MMRVKNKLFILLALFLFLCASAVLLTNEEVYAITTPQVFSMDTGAYIRFDEDSSKSGLRFVAYIDSESAEEITKNDNQTFGALIIPVSYVEGIEDDFIEELSKTPDVLTGRIAYMSASNFTFIKDGVECNSIACSLTSLKNNSLNRDYFGIMFIETTDGQTTTYQYASIPKDQNGNNANVRSLAMTANNAYNSGESFSEEQIKCLESYIVKSNYMLNHTEITNEDDLEGILQDKDDENSIESLKNAIAFKDDVNSVSLNKGETFQIEFNRIATAQYSCENEEVATVSNEGLITAVGEGETTVNVVVLGKELSFSVSCTDGFVPVSQKITVFKNNQEFDISTATKTEVPLIENDNQYSVVLDSKKHYYIIQYQARNIKTAFTNNPDANYVSFKIKVDNATENSNFTWYGTKFTLVPNEWITIKISKSDFLASSVTYLMFVAKGDFTFTDFVLTK